MAIHLALGDESRVPCDVIGGVKHRKFNARIDGIDVRSIGTHFRKAVGMPLVDLTAMPVDIKQANTNAVKKIDDALECSRPLLFAGRRGVETVNEGQKIAFGVPHSLPPTGDRYRC